MTNYLWIVIPVIAIAVFIFFNSDVWEDYRKKEAARKASRPRKSSITPELKDIFKPLI